MPKELNPLLHSQLRLGVMSILMVKEEADFVYLKEKTESTAGNLSVQLDKLARAGYITIEKGFAISPSKKALKGNAHAPHAASPPKEGLRLRSTSIR